MKAGSDHEMDHQGNHCCEEAILSHNSSVYKGFFSFTTRTALLVQQWTTAAVTGVALGAIVGIILSIVLEALKCYVFVHKMTFVYKQISSVRAKQPSVPRRIFGSILHMIHAVTGYLLMLLAMSFNAWIMIAVVFGAGLGHFFIRPVLVRMVQLKYCRYLRKHTPVRVLQGCPCKVRPPDYSSPEQDQRMPMGEECRCGETKHEENDGNSSDEEKAASNFWDPIRQSRQFQVEGKETSV